MSEMKVGDIGVLQNIPANREIHNGELAELAAVFMEGEHVKVCETPSASKIYRCDKTYYAVKLICSAGSKSLIQPHQIRPITDPDAIQETEEAVSV